MIIYSDTIIPICIVDHIALNMMVNQPLLFGKPSHALGELTTTAIANPGICCILFKVVPQCSANR